MVIFLQQTVKMDPTASVNKWICKQEKSMKRASGGENEGPGVQSIPWEPLTHAKLQSLGLELPARPSNCLQVPGETTKRSNCEEIWLKSVSSEKKVSLKKMTFWKGRVWRNSADAKYVKVLYCVDVSKRQTNKKETTVNSDAKIPEDQAKVKAKLVCCPWNHSPDFCLKPLCWCRAKENCFFSSIFSGFRGLFCKLVEV